MFVKYHVGLSAAFSGAVYGVTGSGEMAAASMASGVLVDLDHVVDFLVEYGLCLNPKKFLRLVYKARYQRVFYLLHGWEWLLLGTTAAWVLNWNPWALGLVMGHAHHLALDHFGNRARPFSYSLLWRWRRGFDHGRCFPHMAQRVAADRAARQQSSANPPLG